MYLHDNDMCKIVNGSQTKLITPTLQVDWEKTNGKVKASIHNFENYESFMNHKFFWLVI